MNKSPIELVNDAIDAIIALEGSTVYPYGLPPCFCDSLARLRKDSALLLNMAESTVAKAAKVHLAPQPGSLRTGCCGLPATDLSAADGLTVDMRKVTCPAFDLPPTKEPGMIRQMINKMDKSVKDQADAEALKTVQECVHKACRPLMRKRYVCKLTINGKEAEHQVRITSKPYRGVAYVQRLVKSTNRFGAKRYYVKSEDIREELY